MPGKFFVSRLNFVSSQVNFFRESESLKGCSNTFLSGTDVAFPIEIKI